MQNNKQYDLLKLSQYGSMERKDIKPKLHVAPYDERCKFRKGDILDANSVLDYIYQYSGRKIKTLSDVKFGEFNVDGQTYNVKLIYTNGKVEYTKIEGIGSNGEVTISLGDIDENELAALKEELKGEKGDPFTYSDFTLEQLASLKGEKGDPFEYTDFTLEQLANLKGEKGDSFEYTDFTQALLEALKGEPGRRGAGITNITTNKSGKTTTVTIEYEDNQSKSFIVLDGQDAQGGGQTTPLSKFRSICFTRSTNIPAKPVGGSYDSPIPTTEGWEDGIPVGELDIWSSNRLFTSDGEFPQESEWSTPAKMADVVDKYDVEFSPYDNVDGDPSTDSDKWFDPSDTLPNNITWNDMIWRAERVRIDDVWFPWVVTKIKGEKGNPGQSSFISTMFVRMNSTPTKPTGGNFYNPNPTSLAGINSDNTLVYWQDGIPSGNNILWQSQCLFTSDGKLPLTGTWSDPFIVTDNRLGYDVEFAKKYNDGLNDDAVPPLPNSANRHIDGGNINQIWYDPVADKDSIDFTEMYWRAEQMIINGVRQDWVITRIKGEKGDPGLGSGLSEDDIPILYELTLASGSRIIKYSSTDTNGKYSYSLNYINVVPEKYVYSGTGNNRTKTLMPLSTNNYKIYYNVDGGQWYEWTSSQNGQSILGTTILPTQSIKFILYAERDNYENVYDYSYDASLTILFEYDSDDASLEIYDVETGDTVNTVVLTRSSVLIPGFEAQSMFGIYAPNKISCRYKVGNSYVENPQEIIYWSYDGRTYQRNIFYDPSWGKSLRNLSIVFNLVFSYGLNSLPENRITFYTMDGALETKSVNATIFHRNIGSEDFKLSSTTDVIYYFNINNLYKFSPNKFKVKLLKNENNEWVDYDASQYQDSDKYGYIEYYINNHINTTYNYWNKIDGDYPELDSSNFINASTVTFLLFPDNRKTTLIDSKTIRIENTDALAATINSLYKDGKILPEGNTGGQETDNPDKPNPTTYYWYAGQENPSNMSEISPIVSDNSSPGWRQTGTSLDANYSYDSTANPITSNPSVNSTWYFALPDGSGLGVFDAQNTNYATGTPTSTVTISGVKYNIWTVGSSRKFGAYEIKNK